MRPVVSLLCVLLVAPAAAAARPPTAAPTQPGNVAQVEARIQAVSSTLASLYRELKGILALIEQLEQEREALAPPGDGDPDAEAYEAWAAQVDRLEARIDEAKTELDAAHHELAELERRLPHADGDRREAQKKLEAAKALRLKTRKRWWAARKLLRSLKRTQFRANPRPTK